MRGKHTVSRLYSTHKTVWIPRIFLTHLCEESILIYARNRHCVRPDLKPGNIDIIELRSDHFAQVCFVKQKC